MSNRTFICKIERLYVKGSIVSSQVLIFKISGTDENTPLKLSRYEVYNTKINTVDLFACVRSNFRYFREMEKMQREWTSGFAVKVHFY